MHWGKMVNCSVVWQIKFKFVQRTEEQPSLLSAPKLRSLHFWLYRRASGLTELPVCTSGKTPEWKVYTGFRSAHAPIQMASSSGKLNHILHLSVEQSFFWFLLSVKYVFVGFTSFCSFFHILNCVPAFFELGLQLFWEQPCFWYWFH